MLYCSMTETAPKGVLFFECVTDLILMVLASLKSGRVMNIDWTINN